jgi:hypothetical protein
MYCSNVRAFQLKIGVLALCFLLALVAADAHSSATDGRQVWEYTGGYGPDWFVHADGRKWILYRGDGRTFLYVEDLSGTLTTPAILVVRPRSRCTLTIQAGVDSRTAQ